MLERLRPGDLPWIAVLPRKKNREANTQSKISARNNAKDGEKGKGKRTKQEQEQKLLCPIRKSFEPTWLKCTRSYRRTYI